MRTTYITRMGPFVLLAVMGFGGAAFGGELSSESGLDALVGAGQKVALSDLATVRGGSDDFDFDHMFDSDHHDNTAIDNGSTRSNTIVDAAFSGASGIATVIQNSGNNVVIQTATIVTINHH